MTEVMLVKEYDSESGKCIIKLIERDGPTKRDRTYSKELFKKEYDCIPMIGVKEIELQGE